MQCMALKGQLHGEVLQDISVLVAGSLVALVSLMVSWCSV